ncbi:hypothetical protein [Halococcus thailandensis]|uniref:Uncharacterized protein n=1 Tax=Halococcus thailandensis JCM 13552 TaxID=1227457 RepID=M0N138_9EURY|nr:hypothetical protein [Halococcus thailandensis]EMA51541.1 hypothetical protein C451_14790 [Halococcus thailandensis JCM 13552]
MESPSPSERGRLLAIGFLLLFVPAVFLMVTLLILVIGRNILLNDLTLARIVELYLVKVLLFTVLLFVLYKLLEDVSIRRIPGVLDESDRRKYEEASDDAESFPDAPDYRENREQ